MASHSIPLCLPDNCSWNESTNEYEKRGESRSTLKVINAALRKLRSIQGRVCVVAIAGPCRRGKSYILSKVFTDETIFPLGHLMDPETMGLWMYVVQEKFKDANGEEFTVVLIDSEGTDSVLSMRRDDDVIFTLTVLLSNILIYNSSSVPKRSDLEALEYPFS